MLRAKPDPVEILILGAGWTSQFLLPLLHEQRISAAATTTSGRAGTIPFRFDPDSQNRDSYLALPAAKTVLVTFPLRGTGQSKLLTDSYRQVNGNENNWIQLGSSGIYTAQTWHDHNSSYDTSNARAIAEDELIQHVNGCVLNLAGLYGGERNPVHWVPRVAKTKAELKQKMSLHLIHGQDVARAIVALHANFTPAKRWIVTDLRVYCWWDLIQGWATQLQAFLPGRFGIEEAKALEYSKWVNELLEEEGVRALPRGADSLGRALDSRAFWKVLDISPSMGRVN